MTHRTFIIPASVVVNARALCKGLAPVGGDGMFVIGLCPKGSPIGTPATHFINSGPIGEDMAMLLPCKHVTRDVDGSTIITTAPGMPSAVPALALKAGITTTLTKINALYGAIDISDQDPHEAVERVGLEFCRTALP